MHPVPSISTKIIKKICLIHKIDSFDLVLPVDKYPMNKTIYNKLKNNL